jgi:hypothetical protein
MLRELLEEGHEPKGLECSLQPSVFSHFISGKRVQPW